MVSILSTPNDPDVVIHSGTPPDFSDCFCDNGTCIAVGEKDTETAPTNLKPVVTATAVATEAAVPTTDTVINTDTAEVSTETAIESTENIETSTGATGPNNNSVMTTSVATESSGDGGVSTGATEAASTDPGSNVGAATETDASTNGDLMINSYLNAFSISFGFTVLLFMY